ncbi:hypothetical protein [Paenibacillus radicis (ex Xue et al. 2023)]|nr:hypothetical protein [Paenibacillus radicis (ex Xue et al. 2023)]MCR8631548.1 hypothetical protein [Paenibacillus radicis (ex Xue et al. 2023)]
MEGTSRILLSTEEQQAAVESISLSIQELSIMAEELQASIGRFKV